MDVRPVRVQKKRTLLMCTYSSQTVVRWLWCVCDWADLTSQPSQFLPTEQGHTVVPVVCFLYTPSRLSKRRHAGTGDGADSGSSLLHLLPCLLYVACRSGGCILSVPSPWHGHGRVTSRNSPAPAVATHLLRTNRQATCSSSLSNQRCKH